MTDSQKHIQNGLSRQQNVTQINVHTGGQMYNPTDKNSYRVVSLNILLNKKKYFYNKKEREKE